MRSKHNRLRGVNLYLILDAEVLDHGRLLNVLKEAVRFGVDIVQLRDKFGSARDILLFSKHALKVTRRQVPYIINDRLDLALLAKADGVHLGQEDVPAAEARRFLGHGALIGVSCQTQAHLRKAQADGADYVGFGSVFKTRTKPGRNPMDLKVLKRILSAAQVPVFPIGGITRGNVGMVHDAGARRAAVCRDILLASNPGQAVRALKEKLE